MLDTKQLKVEGLRFARSLQMLVKMVNIFSADHTSAAGMLRRSYDLLNPLLKQSRHLTFGFVEQRILLNSILTSDDTLKPLENEFLKRGIGAVSFDAGITLAAFTRAIAALAASPKLIEESGGLQPFLASRQLEFVKIFPAAKSEVRNADGDTVLDVGSEEYLISKALSNVRPGSSHGIEAILGHMESTGGEESTNGYFSGSAPFGGGGNGGAALGSKDAGSPVEQGGGSFAAGEGRHGSRGALSEIQRMAEQKFEASLANPDEDPQKAYVELARVLTSVRQDSVLSSLTGGTAPVQDGAPKEEATAEVFEDTALRWALRRLASTAGGDEAVIVEEQVFRVLMRSLQATHAASRLAQKLAEYAKEFALPKHTFDRLQQEVRWLTLTPQGRFRELLAVEHFSASEFRRALELIKELIRAGNIEEARALGAQYFSIFEDHASIRIEEVGRIPELLRTFSGAEGEFWIMAEDRLSGALVSNKLNQLIHVQVVNALVALAWIAASYENFDLVRNVGGALEHSAARDPKAHDRCCNNALRLLVQPAAADRIVEIFLERRNDSVWTKTVTGLLRWSDPTIVERIFSRLDQEPLAANRLALLRLLVRVGPAALIPARQRLQRPEWYVVRNACKLLGELKDPQLLDQLRPISAHEDERVQKAVFQAIKESRLPKRKRAIAEALPSLSSMLLEDALSELMFQPNLEILSALENYFSVPRVAGSRAMVRVVNVVAAIPDAPAAETLARIALNDILEETVRQAAREALAARRSVKEPAKDEISSLDDHQSQLAEASHPAQLPEVDQPHRLAEVNHPPQLEPRLDDLRSVEHLD
jgi:hypothetical protein